MQCNIVNEMRHVMQTGGKSGTIIHRSGDQMFIKLTAQEDLALLSETRDLVRDHIQE